jgi:hypothetical protein
VDLSSILKRIPILWQLRSAVRERFFAAMRRVAFIQESREVFSDLLNRQNAPSFPRELSADCVLEAPYPELRRERRRLRACHRSDVIFVTGRFRSGSTLIWNLFRNVPSFTSYYEPFNERRWFDPATRGSHVDATHLKVRDYWAEYDGLDVLGNYFSADWKFQRLYMPAHAWEPGMQRYIETLIERAPGRPVLQFNEMDLRLPWLRARFPSARILHIFRHPRDQWCSALGRDLKSSRSNTVREFAAIDGFYLLQWGRDLHSYFPFLTLDERSHPYELFYQIWKLSYLFGRLYADVSIALEDLLASPESGLRTIFSKLAAAEYDASTLLPLVRPGTVGKWRSYAADEWFAAIEEQVDETFVEFGNAAAAGGPLNRKVTTLPPRIRARFAAERCRSSRRQERGPWSPD